MRVVFVIVSLFLAACSTPRQPAPAAEEKKAAEQRYELRGEIVSLDRKAQTARIQHEEIKGWMDAMTMDFPVRDKAEFDRLKPGDRITATVFAHDLDYSIGEIKIEPPQP